LIAVRDMLILRLAVGLLGEKDQGGWWLSSFFSFGSTAFLAPVFGRGIVLARYMGVTEAAGRMHDDRIGLGRVFHLFRLPEALELRLFDLAKDPSELSAAALRAGSAAAAAAVLAEMAPRPEGARTGPARVGTVSDLAGSTWPAIVAGYYRQALAAGHQTFPYFTERA
jgi:hypothetical protein